MRVHSRRGTFEIGGLLVIAVIAALLWFAGEGKASFGFESFENTITNRDGSLDVQAGSHPYALTTTLQLNRHAGLPDDEVKDVVAELPPGLVGNPSATQKCTIKQFDTQATTAIPGSSYLVSGASCPANSQVGVAKVDLALLRGGPVVSLSFGIFNLVAPPGVPAEFGFKSVGLPVILTPTVRTGNDYGLNVVSKNTSQISAVFGVATTFWGVPGDPVHDGERGECLGFEGEPLDVCSVETGVKPFLTLPSNCSGKALTMKIHADSWQEPGSLNPDGSPNLEDPRWKTAPDAVIPAVTGCEHLQFRSNFNLTPDSTQADAPTGDSAAEVRISQDESPEGLATPDLKEVVVTAPMGVSLNPGAADGLGACNDEQAALSTTARATCPDSSVVGTVKITTPLLEAPLEGQIFVRTPECNPCTANDARDGHMLRLLIEAEGSGVLVKIGGTASADPSTGQLAVTFKETPQAPVSDVLLTFNGGARAVFINPLNCGAAVLNTEMTPWSSPFTPSATPTGGFNVDWDGHGGACPASPPFAPTFTAGSVISTAGAFTPFSVTLSRPDRNGRLAGLQVQTPTGVSGILAGVTLCREPQATQGICPSAARIGTATVAAGTGGHPFWLSGPVYLTGPYAGAPFGLSVAVPAEAGPFNLGKVVVRAAIRVDPTTAALTITSDPFPQIVAGVPTRIQTVNVTVDRPDFTFNPTSCSAKTVAATATSVEGAAAQLSSPFAAGACSHLPFKPVFSATTRGKASHNRNGASLNVRLTAKGGPGAGGGEANVAKVNVQLPKLLPARLTTLQKACTAAQFAENPAHCPRASDVGTAVAKSPILSVPVRGPAYLVSHGGAAFPDLEIVLQGEGVTLVLDGHTDIKNGITYSRFESVPDAPIKEFSLSLPIGPYSALASPIGSLCGKKLQMPTTITAQNGAVLHQKTNIKITGCPKARKVVKHPKKAIGKPSARSVVQHQRGGDNR